MQKRLYFYNTYLGKMPLWKQVLIMLPVTFVFVTLPLLSIDYFKWLDKFKYLSIGLNSLLLLYVLFIFVVNRWTDRYSVINQTRFRLKIEKKS